MNQEQQKAILSIALLAAFADGRTTAAERSFLEALSRALGLDVSVTAAIEQQAETMVELAEVAAPAAVAASVTGAVAAGGLAKQFGKAATSVAFSFATTYALGRVAKRYYAGGRQMSGELLRETFQNVLGPAKQMQADYLPQIQQKADNLDVGQIMNLVRGG